MLEGSRAGSPIVLVYPRTGYDFGFGLAPPHGVLALAAHLRASGLPNPVSILDQRTERRWEESLGAALRREPLLVGISTMTGVQLKHALEIARAVRTASPRTPILFGGVHVSLLPEQTLESPWIDLGIVGEGELPLQRLIEALNDGEPIGGIAGLAFKDGARIVVNAAAEGPDLASLPGDRFVGVDIERYVFKRGGLLSDRELDLGETSRGCHRRCGYCYNTVFHAGRWRALGARATIARIDRAVAEHRLRSIWLRDDNFFVDVDRAAEIIDHVAGTGVGLYLPGITIQEFQRLPRRTLRTLGSMRGALLRFGVEAGSGSVLKAIRKGFRPEEVYAANRSCADHGIVPSYNFMVGFPSESPGDVLLTVGMMKRLKRENPAAQLNAVNLYTPYPGTALFDAYRAQQPDAVPHDVEGWTTFHHLNVKRGGLSGPERRMYENVVTISYVVSDTFWRSLGTFQRLALTPLRWWFGVRWRLDAFRLAPEVQLLRWAKKFFLSIP